MKKPLLFTALGITLWVGATAAIFSLNAANLSIATLKLPVVTTVRQPIIDLTLQQPAIHQAADIKVEDSKKVLDSKTSENKIEDAQCALIKVPKAPVDLLVTTYTDGIVAVAKNTDNTELFADCAAKVEKISKRADLIQSNEDLKLSKDSRNETEKKALNAIIKAKANALLANVNVRVANIKTVLNAAIVTVNNLKPVAAVAVVLPTRGLQLQLIDQLVVDNEVAIQELKTDVQVLKDVDMVDTNDVSKEIKNVDQQLNDMKSAIKNTLTKCSEQEKYDYVVAKWTKNIKQVQDSLFDNFFASLEVYGHKYDVNSSEIANLAQNFCQWINSKLAAAEVALPVEVALPAERPLPAEIALPRAIAVPAQ